MWTRCSGGRPSLVLEVDAHLLGDRAQLACRCPATRGCAGSSGTPACTSGGSEDEPRSFCCSRTYRHRLRKARKSLVSSLKRACCWSACVCLSAGRSRGSWMESAAAITMTSRTQPFLSASRTIRASRGSTGSWASLRPSCGEPLARVLLRRVERAQLLEELDAVADVAVVRRVDEGELLDVAEAGRGHLEDDGGQVRPEDLGVRELRAGEEVVLAVQPDADAVGGTAAAALALVGAGLARPPRSGSRWTLVRWL